MTPRLTCCALALLLPSACLSIEYTAPTGGGGSGAAGAGGGGDGGSASGGAASGGQGEGGGCVVTCSDDHRCGDDGCGGLCNDEELPSTFGARMPLQGLYLVPWPETESVIYASDKNELHRVDTCRGELLASVDLSNAGDRFIRGLARVGDDLFVLVNEPGPVGVEPKSLLVLDARTLALVREDPVDAGTDNGLWSSAAGASFFWANLANAGVVMRVGLDGSSCARDLGDTANEAGGIALLDESALTARRDSFGNYVFYRVQSCDAGQPLAAGAPAADGFVPYSIAVADGLQGPLAFAAGFYPDPTPAPNCGTALRARLAQVDLSTLNATGLVDYDPVDCVSGFVSATARGSSVYASGGKEGATTAGGDAWVVRFDANQLSNVAPTEQLVSGGALAWFVASDSEGVYLSGATKDASQGAGFLVKCTASLSECGAVP